MMYKHRVNQQKKKKAKICNNLLLLANKLSEQGFDRLAEHVTGLLKIALKQ